MKFNEFIEKYSQFSILKETSLKISQLISLSSVLLGAMEEFFKLKVKSSEFNFDISEKLFIDFGLIFPEQSSKDTIRKMIKFEKTEVNSNRKYLTLSEHLENIIFKNKNKPNLNILLYDAYKKYYGFSKILSKRDRTPFILMAKNFVNIPDKKRVADTFKYIEDLDKKVYDNRFFRRFGKPDILFIPGMANGTYDSTDNFFVLPINMPKTYEDYIAPVFISYRWQLDSDWEFRSSYMNLPNYSKLNSKKLMQKMISDYKLWLFKEKKGYKVLTKEVREWISWQIAKEPIKKKKPYSNVSHTNSPTNDGGNSIDEDLKVDEELNQITEKKQLKKLTSSEVLELVNEGFASGEDLLAINNYYWETLKKILSLYKEKNKLSDYQKMFVNFGLTYKHRLNYPMNKIILSGLTIITFSDYIFEDLKDSMNFEINDRIDILRKIMELAAKRDRTIYCPLLFKGQQLIDLNEAVFLMSELLDSDFRLKKYRIVRKSGIPSILLAPGRSNGFYFWESSVFVLPIVPIKDTEHSVYSMYAIFKWENDEEIRTEYKMLKSVVKLNSLNSQRSFIKDLTLWFSREKKGYKVLEKEKKKFFERFFVRKEKL
jgi:hypothetical protein